MGYEINVTKEIPQVIEELTTKHMTIEKIKHSITMPIDWKTDGEILDEIIEILKEYEKKLRKIEDWYGE